MDTIKSMPICTLLTGVIFIFSVNLGVCKACAHAYHLVNELLLI